MSYYELAVLGRPSDEHSENLARTLTEMIGELGLRLGEDVVLHDAATLGSRNPRVAFAAAYFGSDPPVDEEAVQKLVADSMPIIPVFSGGQNFNSVTPETLRFANGLRLRPDDHMMTELAVSLLECVGLLRRQRRVFISYRRSESKALAVQLHDVLTSRAFDVFLDTHDIRPGEPFQDVLWHRLVDSDVVVMLDTPTYFGSKWTIQELGRARAKEIQVLRVVWPTHVPTKFTSLSETYYLTEDQLEGADGPVRPEVADEIALNVERLRSLSIAARYMSITGKLRADVEKIGASVEAIGAHRAIAVKLLNDRVVWAYPVVGVPTAETFNDIADKAEAAGQSGAPILVYDHIGLKESWRSHLAWLQRHLNIVQAIKVNEAGWELAAMEA